MSPEVSDTLSKGLSVRGLRKSYRKRMVIRDVSLTLNRGEVVALLGPNGSGKTTTFYAIAGLIGSDGGQVLLDGKISHACQCIEERVWELDIYRRKCPCFAV